VIDQLFTLPSTIERLREGPFQKHLDAYAAVVTEQGYAPNSVRSQIVVIADFGQWLQQRHIEVASLKGSVMDRFLKTRGRQRREASDVATIAHYVDSWPYSAKGRPSSQNQSVT
jgi:site-specific recombinase XerD